MVRSEATTCRWCRLPAAPAAASANPNADIRRDYELAERVGTKEAWDFFVAAHPSGFYADLAKAQRNKLAAEEARIAATERARQAAEERARLASEGAKASEQAKAAAQSKAAEEAKLAAEKKKQAEEAKVAAAENAKQRGEAIASAEPSKPGTVQPDVARPADAARGRACAVQHHDRPADTTGSAAAAANGAQAGRVQDRRRRRRMECLSPPGTFLV